MKLRSLLKPKITKRGIQISLGILWLLDGALQLQHQMFSSAFANQVIAPAGQGQPVIVSGPMNFEIHTLLLHPAIFNAFFALIQLALGVLIINKRTIKLGLLASVAWGLGVWYMGEGLGGLLSGQATILMGAPGAAVIYAVLALAVLPSKATKTKAKQDFRPAHWLAIVWAVLWISGAVFQLLPGQNSVADLSVMIAGNASGAPGWMASIDNHVANDISNIGVSKTVAKDTAIQPISMASMPGMEAPMSPAMQTSSRTNSGYWFIILLFIVQLAVGLGVFAKGNKRKISIGVGIVFSLVFWVIGQSLGAYFTGLATDPNTAPLFIVLGVAVVGSSQLNFKLLKQDTSRVLKKLSSRMGGASVSSS